MQRECRQTSLGMGLRVPDYPAHVTIEDPLMESSSGALTDVNASSDEGDDEVMLQMIAAVEVILRGLGEDVQRQGILRTPLRVARAMQCAVAGQHKSARDIIGSALFHEDQVGEAGELRKGGGAGGMVIVRDVDLFSCCRGCLHPLKLRCHLAYIPSHQRVVGLSKLPRIAEAYARRLQTPQRLANELAEAVLDAFEPQGVAVIVESWHLGGVEAGTSGIGWQAVTGGHACAAAGEFRVHTNGAWEEFVALLGLEVEVCMLGKKGNMSNCSYTEVRESCNGGGAMEGEGRGGDGRGDWVGKSVQAAESLIRAMGTDLSGGEVRGSAERYVRQLRVATRGTSRSLTSILKSHAAAEGLNSVRRHSRDGDARVSPFTIGSNCVSCVLPLSQGEDDGGESLVVLKEVSFASLCEHHLLPFFGKVFIGIVCKARESRERKHVNGNEVGPACRKALSFDLLRAIVEMYALRPQVQERLTFQIAEVVTLLLGSEGTIVVVEASHMCMVTRGVGKADSWTSSVATLGVLSNNSESRRVFLRHIRK